jgi:hypothetical protein
MLSEADHVERMGEGHTVLVRNPKGNIFGNLDVSGYGLDDRAIPGRGGRIFSSSLVSKPALGLRVV